MAACLRFSAAVPPLPPSSVLGLDCEAGISICSGCGAFPDRCPRVHNTGGVDNVRFVGGLGDGSTVLVSNTGGVGGAVIVDDRPPRALAAVVPTTVGLAFPEDGVDEDDDGWRAKAMGVSARNSPSLLGDSFNTFSASPAGSLAVEAVDSAPTDELLPELALPSTSSPTGEREFACLPLRSSATGVRCC